MEFAAFHSYVSNIKILPEGEKIYTSEDLKYKKYCSNCGSKVKPNDKYCSKCGNKL
jgi:rRNA maturation endonuclease Nob1